MPEPARPRRDPPRIPDLIGVDLGGGRAIASQDPSARAPDLGIGATERRRAGDRQIYKS
ncbi:MAG TPA: hypothetical protein VKV23_03885 [Acidimicrobiales bacterium]|nr:hypothetical protein [Acidimicrobiales bacterium]